MDQKEEEVKKESSDPQENMQRDQNESKMQSTKKLNREQDGDPNQCTKKQESRSKRPDGDESKTNKQDKRPKREAKAPNHFKEFACLTDEEISQQRKAIRNKHTLMKNKEVENKFMRYLENIEELDDLDYWTFSVSDLDLYLGRFYWNLRTREGTEYKAKSLEGFKFGLNRCLQERGAKFDIVKDSAFARSNKV